MEYSLEYYEVSFWVSFMALVLKFILSDKSIATPAFLSSPFAWNILFQPFTFSLFKSFFRGGSLTGSICVGHDFLSNQLLLCFYWSL